MSTNAPSAALIQIAVSASQQRMEGISLVRETMDGLPIGWILRFGALHGEAALATVFFQPDDGDGESAFNHYLSHEPATAEQVSGWARDCGPAPVDEEISALFEQAMSNGWEVSLERRDHSFHTHPTPDLLTLRAEASDYERRFSREPETVIVSRYEGEEEFAVIMRDSYKSGGYRPLHISLAEATAILNAPAPMTVGVHAYDEDKEDWILPSPKEGN